MAITDLAEVIIVGSGAGVPPRPRPGARGARAFAGKRRPLPRDGSTLEMASWWAPVILEPRGVQDGKEADRPEEHFNVGARPKCTARAAALPAKEFAPTRLCVPGWPIALDELRYY